VKSGFGCDAGGIADADLAQAMLDNQASIDKVLAKIHRATKEYNRLRKQQKLLRHRREAETREASKLVGEMDNTVRNESVEAAIESTSATQTITESLPEVVNVDQSWASFASIDESWNHGPIQDVVDETPPVYPRSS